jgi:hypothetical protein
VEHVIAESDAKHFSTLLDIQMMCWGTGRERTTQEYAGLLQQAGWNSTGIRFPAGRVIGVIESKKR